MALLDKLLNPSLFKPKWQHKDATVRKQALAHLTDEQILVHIAQQDTHKDIRLLALSKIRSANLLAEFLVSEHTDLRKQAQHQHLVYLLPNQSQNDLHKITNDNDLVSIATFTDNEELRLAAINKLSDESLRLDIACNNPVAKVRLAAAQGITKSDSLQSLMHIAQGKDKALYRFCKEQLAKAKAEDDAAFDLQEKITRCINHAEQLAKSAYSPEYNGRLHLLKQNWAALSQQNLQQQQAFNAALVKCEETLAAHIAEEKAVQDKISAINAAKETFVDVLIQLEKLEFNDDIASQLKGLEQSWQTAKQVAKPEADQHKTFENTLQAWSALDNTRRQLVDQQEPLQDLIKQSQQLEKSSLNNSQNLQKNITKAIKQLSWKPATVNANIEPPALLTELDQALQAVIKHNQNLTAHEADSSKHLAKLLTTLEEHINEGHLKDANKCHQHTMQALKKISHQEAKKFQRQFQNLTAQLAEIRDWQGYAATPKKEALCANMEALAESSTNESVDPSVLADKISALQEEWKTLGPIDRQADKILWNRFHTAADKAYLPCKAHYAEMAILRQQNLVNRQQLIAQLTEYEASMDWESADWGIVQKTLDAAREAFRNFSPVDRHEHKNSQASLQTISDKIYAHIKAEYQKNIEAKESLISQAEALQEVEDLSQAIAQSKQLQADWKTIGMTPNKVDQKLWQAFRIASDAVFSRRDEQRQQNKIQIEGNIELAQSIIVKAESAAKAADAESKDILQQCQAEFAELSLPKALYNQLRKRLSDALQQQEDTFSHAKIAKKQQAWTVLADKLMAISLKTTDVSQAENLYQAEAITLPQGIDKSLVETKWTETACDLSTIDALRDACIGLEIIAELSSPAEDQQARMALQVKRLAQGLGQAGSQQQQIENSVNQWLALNADQAWQQRYNQALLAAAKQL